MSDQDKVGIARLKQHYNIVSVKTLQEAFQYKNKFEIPKLEKVVLNMGVGEAALDRKKIEGAVSDLELISGQKAVITKARKPVAGFKLRDNMPVGCKVTLRSRRMYEFLDRLINIALPRMRDFRGLSARSFDGHGNYAMGIREQIVFPEIDYDKVDKIRGMDVVICTNAKSNEEALVLLKSLNMPFNS